MSTPRWTAPKLDTSAAALAALTPAERSARRLAGANQQTSRVMFTNANSPRYVPMYNRSTQLGSPRFEPLVSPRRRPTEHPFFRPATDTTALEWHEHRTKDAMKNYVEKALALHDSAVERGRMASVASPIWDQTKVNTPRERPPYENYLVHGEFNKELAERIAKGG